MLVWGGVQWLLSGAIPARASEARDRVRNAILGLLLVIASFLIIQIINPELTAGLGRNLEVDCDDLKPGSCERLMSPVADGATLFRVPTGEAREGVFICKREQCVCKEDPCKEGDDPGAGDDYWYVDPGVWGVATGSGVGGSGVPNLGNWNDEVKAIAIRGDYGVLLADDTDYNQTVVCFDAEDPTKGGRLDDFLRKSSGELWGFKGAQSLKVLGGGQCKSPGITLFNETDFWDDNIVFLFRNTEQGRWRENNIRYEIPIAYTSGALVFPVPRTRSVYVSPNTTKSAVLRQGLTGSPGVCFQNSVADLSEYDWDPLNSPDDIIDDIGSFGATSEITDCPPELDGVVH